MRITAILERPVMLHGAPANAVVDFSHHTVSLVALRSDVVRGGRPVTGVAFDSIGRFAQSGILRDRMTPRVLAAAPDALLSPSGRIDPAKVLACALRGEKPGGHGDRAAAAAALELACWDLNAKLGDEPACVTIARRHGREPEDAVQVYAGSAPTPPCRTPRSSPSLGHGRAPASTPPRSPTSPPCSGRSSSATPPTARRAR